MKSVKCNNLVITLFLIMNIFVFPPSSGAVSAGEHTSLTDEDCVKCHAGQPATMAASGGKHKGIGCLGCHAGHRPTVKNNIPKCSQCHEGKPHFELKGCADCHKNAHAPLKITFASNLTEPCLSCHTQQFTQLREHKSKHSALSCFMCHSAHRKVPLCTQCHKPHSAEMPSADCRNCHKAHMPKVVTYAESVQSKDCGSCHRKAFDMLSSSMSKHKKLACAFCHNGTHKKIPKCLDCHRLPHKAVVMANLPKCAECHNIAHYLNQWP